MSRLPAGIGVRGDQIGPKADLAQAWAALLLEHATIVPRLDADLRRAVGLPLSWYDVLLELFAAPGSRLTMTELGERVLLSRTRVSRIVDELVAAGLVGRESNPDDGRSAYAVITSEGVTRCRAAAPHYLAGIEREFAGNLTDAQLTAISKALRAATRRPIPLSAPPRSSSPKDHEG